jgi:hypothetical protein
MKVSRSLNPCFLVLAGWLLGAVAALGAAEGIVQQDAGRKLVTLADGRGNLSLRLNYDGRCVLDQVMVRGRQVAGESGVSSGICVDGQWLTTRSGMATPKIIVGKDTLTVKDIVFGKPGFEVHETWQFKVRTEDITWQISRHYPKAGRVEDSAFPEWDFSSLSTWTGGLLGNGGVIWTKYLETTNATYGAHTGPVTFWNRQERDCLRITPTLSKGQHDAVRFSHQANNNFSFNYVVSDQEVQPKHGLCRFLRDRQDLWEPFKTGTGEVSVEFTLQAPAYDQVCHRGTFRGLDGESIDELLNTVGRYGVVDTQLMGGNGWRSGFICTHEQWFAQMGLAVDDPDYIANFATTLNFERDHAIGPDGRVKGRWGYNAGDALPGTYDKLGFYEAQWGYMLDSQPDYVICVAEQFDLTGDRTWLAGQKTACEKALNYLLRREVEGTGLVAVMPDSHIQKRGSDWIDVIWASHENALINAELYYALRLWADAEESLADPARATNYRSFAARLKAAFNRPVAEGGFWDPTNQWYVYWREKGGSIHGNNLVTPVNFTAIGYGLCDDTARQKAILDRMEMEMQKENLFFWPLNFFPYQADEGLGVNFPYPNYENGDLFLSWGELGVRAYAAYDPALALKYVKNTLARYEKDGLSFQRYRRKSQRGAGEDILAGNCLPIVGLYRDIFGIQPKPNRLYLEPHLTGELNGTELRYQLRGKPYVITLSTEGCSVTVGACALRDARPFGINATDEGLEYFPGKSADWAMSITQPRGGMLTVQIEAWPDNPAEPRRWTETGQENGKMRHRVAGLQPRAIYQLKVNNQTTASLVADKAGRIEFASPPRTTGPQQFELGLNL